MSRLTRTWPVVICSFLVLTMALRAAGAYLGSGEVPMRTKEAVAPEETWMAEALLKVLTGAGCRMGFVPPPISCPWRPRPQVHTWASAVSTMECAAPADCSATAELDSGTCTASDMGRPASWMTTPQVLRLPSMHTAWKKLDPHCSEDTRSTTDTSPGVGA